MKMTKKLIIAATALLSFCFISTPVWAGSKQQHRWEGVAIGVGAAIVGSALINHHARGYHTGPPVAFSFNYRENRRHASRHHGYRRPHDGSRHNHWRSYGYKHQYKGHRQHGNLQGNRHRESRRSFDRGYHGGQRSPNRGHGGRRY